MKDKMMTAGRRRRRDRMARGLKGSVAGALAAVLALAPASVYAQDVDWEWEAEDGYHEEEWYDPTDWDWFGDTDQSIDYESDYEWESDDGYHEEEWYDPSDWFDRDQATDYEYDYDWWGYDDDYVYDDYTYGDYDPYNYTYDYELYDDEYVDYGQQEDVFYIWVWDTNNDEWRLRRNDQVRQDDQQRRQANRTTVRGQIDDFGRVNLQGERDDHTIVRIRLEDGTSKLVNLGPRTDLRDLGLDRGDRVMIKGRQGTINDRQVLMAQQFRVEGERQLQRNQRQQQIARDQQRQRQQEQARDQRRQQQDVFATPRQDEQDRRERPQRGQLSGTLQDVTRINLKGTEKDHTLIKLQLQDGSSRVVNIGPNLTMSDLRLSQGDRVQVQGHVGRIAGRQVLMADLIRVRDKTTRTQFGPQDRGQQQRDRAEKRDRAEQRNQQRNPQGNGSQR